VGRSDKGRRHKKIDSDRFWFTPNGSSRIGNPPSRLEVTAWSGTDQEYKSVFVVPLTLADAPVGYLSLKSKKYGFTKNEEELYGRVAYILAIAAAHSHSQAMLRERVKELTCLYGISQLAAQQELSLADILQKILNLLPPAWLYPDIASASITLDGVAYTSNRFQEGVQKQSADIIVQGKFRGSIEVSYSQEMPERHEGPFLKEERSLIDTVAKEVAFIVERKQSEEEKVKLEHQLRHTDRLATIGQLAAGVAHELNEPLNSILGFAQLALKFADLPQQSRQDLEKIASAALYAREVIRKLMLFSRQMPSSKTQVNMNRIVREGLTFFEARCSKAGIELECLLPDDLPEITADPSQMTQVLVNLVVNAIQAMPDGGCLSIQTLAGSGCVSLIVKDTGCGMDQEVLDQIFDPFYTTKDVDQGTGLGLPVIHGIITAHGGTIEVQTVVHEGTRFEIRLPVARAGICKTEGCHPE
jgi:signal transduction histidine kinase